VNDRNKSQNSKEIARILEDWYKPIYQISNLLTVFNNSQKPQHYSLTALSIMAGLNILSCYSVKKPIEI